MHPLRSLFLPFHSNLAQEIRSNGLEHELPVQHGGPPRQLSGAKPVHVIVQRLLENTLRRSDLHLRRDHVWGTYR
jgi:hypothetical protein